MRRRTTIRELKNEAMDTALQAQATLAKAQTTLSHADKAVLQVADKAMRALALFCDLAEAVMDGKAKVMLHVAGTDWPIGGRLDFDDDKE